MRCESGRVLLGRLDYCRSRLAVCAHSTRDKEPEPEPEPYMNEGHATRRHDWLKVLETRRRLSKVKACESGRYRIMRAAGWNRCVYCKRQAATDRQLFVSSDLLHCCCIFIPKDFRWKMQFATGSEGCRIRQTPCLQSNAAKCTQKKKGRVDIV